MNIGYVFTKNLIENPGNQVEILGTAGCDKVIREKIGDIKSRPILNNCLKNLRSGDVFIVSNIDRIAGSLRDLAHIFNRVSKAGANIYIIDQDIDTRRTPALFNMTDHFADFDNKIRLEKTDRTKKRGPKRKFSNHQIQGMFKMYDDNVKIRHICTEYEVSAPSFWRFLKNRESYLSEH